MFRASVFLIVVLQASPPLGAEAHRERFFESEEADSTAGQGHQAAQAKPGQVRYGEFAKDLGKNFLGLFSKDNITPFLIGSAATGGASLLDDRLQGYFGPVERLGPAGDILGETPGSSVFIGGAIGALVITSQYKGGEEFKAMSYSLAQGFVLGNLMTTGVKLAVGRDRPDRSNRRSFPSGHTSNAFSFATIFSHYHPKATIPAYLAATIVAASRMDEDVHYFSDVVAGATLGYLVGRTVVRQATRKKQSITWMPYFSPSRREAGVRVTAVF